MIIISAREDFSVRSITVRSSALSSSKDEMMVSENARISSIVAARAEFFSVLTADRVRLHKVVLKDNLSRVASRA
jgi:hypothetical protein